MMLSMKGKIFGKHNRRTITTSLVLVFFTIYFNLSSLAVSLRMTNETYLIISLGTITTLFFYKIFKQQRFIFRQDALIFFIITCVLILSSMSLNQDFDILNIVILVQIFIAFLFIHMIEFDDFIESYVKIMLFIAIYSLIVMFIIVPFAKSVSTIFPIRYNSVGYAVRDYIFSFHFETHSVAMRRNTGIFREMGVYQHYLNLALMFYLFHLKKNKILTIAVFSIAIISTFSTPGILFLIGTLTLFLFENRNKQFINILKLLGILFLGFVILSFITPSLTHDFVGALDKFLGQGNSYQGRTGAILGNILAWAESPVLGNGVTQGVSLAGELYLEQFNVHNTSTTTSFLAIYGVFFALMMSIPIVLLIFNFKIKSISKIILVVILLISLNSQRLIYDQLYYILVLSYFIRTRKKVDDTLREKM